jgi:hypothetical protein
MTQTKHNPLILAFDAGGGKDLDPTDPHAIKYSFGHESIEEVLKNKGAEFDEKQRKQIYFGN